MFPGFDRWKIAACNYYAANDCHSGQWSEGYKTLCRVYNGRIRYKPAPSWRGIEDATREECQEDWLLSYAEICQRRYGINMHVWDVREGDGNAGTSHVAYVCETNESLDSRLLEDFIPDEFHELGRFDGDDINTAFVVDEFEGMAAHNGGAYYVLEANRIDT